jgi:CheY-like chemotaxis protein
MTRHLAQLMGGTAGVSSTPGKGSTFWFTARLAVQSASLQSAADEQPDEDLSARLARDFSGYRLLLVEDEPINQEVARFLLEEAGLCVDVAADGIQATDLAASHDYSLILMDMQMPVMDGLNATSRILPPAAACAHPGRRADRQQLCRGSGALPAGRHVRFTVETGQSRRLVRGRAEVAGCRSMKDEARQVMEEMISGTF